MRERPVVAEPQGLVGLLAGDGKERQSKVDGRQQVKVQGHRGGEGHGGGGTGEGYRGGEGGLH